MPNKRDTQKSYAKINLCLAIHYPPIEGGYHKLDSVFQEISLHDTLRFELVKRRDFLPDEFFITPDSNELNSELNPMYFARTKAQSFISLDCDDATDYVCDNLIFCAIDAMEQAFNHHVCSGAELLDIAVDKHIPAGGGLGGGSSNAAAAIRAYCNLCGFDANDKRALHVAQSLGADVAFFLQGGAALMKGRGDVLERVLPSFPLPLVLMGSKKGCNTGKVYKAFDEDPIPAPDVETLAQAMEGYATVQGPVAKSVASLMLAKACKNNLTHAAYKVLPPLQHRIEHALKSKNILGACVTGSGSTCFAICGNEETAKAFAQEAASYCDWIKVVHAL